MFKFLQIKGLRLSSFISLLLLFAFALNTYQANAQCDVNNPYDKIISGYHASIAIKTNGVYSIWGTSMKADGSSDQLSPQDIDATNYPGLTGTIIKAALGGKSSGAAVDQAILLTSTGLWAWGVEGNVLKTSLTTSSAFARITSPSGAQSTGLPTGVAPTDVKTMFATYQTLVLLTNSGNVWVLTQTSLALEGNGGTASTAGSSTWKQVKTDAANYLSDIKNVRAQVTSATYNAFIAETNSGDLYTWGNTTFLGNSTAASARNYATLMTLPSGVASSGIKMIGVTGGGVENTYYLVSNDGKLYALGDNSQRQCGDFTTTDRTAWVQAKKSVTAGDYLTNINYISVQEHNSSYPAAAAITSTGDLYTWGNNSKKMLGRPIDGDMYDPGFSGGFTSGTNIALFAEIGGHTLVYAKVGTSQFCYVGHRIQGSMGDGTSTDATEAIFNCNTTPSLSLCGSVPVAADLTKSTITANPTTITANGTSTSTITVQLKNASNVNLTTTGGTVVIYTNKGTIGSVTDNNNGTYSALLTSSTNIESATLTFTINTSNATASATVDFISSGATPTITNTSSITFLENSINATPGLLYASTSSSYASATPIFTGKTMKIEYVTSGGTSTTGLTEDNLGVRNQGSNAGEVNVTLGSTNTIKVGSTTVGTFPSSLTGSGVSSEYLLITWSGSPTLAQVNAVLNNITYKTSSDVPTLVRYVKLTILDGSSTLTNQMTVNVTRENDAPRAGAINTRSDITANGDEILIYPSGSSSPWSEGVANAIDNSSSTKYLNFSGSTQVTGLVVTPSTGATIVTKLTFTSANDDYGRDPITYKLEGSRDRGGSFTSIVNSGATNLTTTRFNKTEGVEFSNTEWYTTYRLTFPTLRAAGAYMQIGEIELLGLPYQRVVYTLGSSPAIVVHNLLPLSDVDNASETITSATVKITTNLSANDVLTWTNQAGIAGSYNSGTGILSFTGSASISTYQTLLRSVKFSTTAPNSALKERLVTFQITDAGGLSSNEAEARVIVTYPPTLTSVNNLGTANKLQTNNITYTILSNAAQNFTDSDTEDLPLKFKVKSVGSNGTLTKAGSAISVENIISSGETIVWTPSSNGSNVVIMTVRAFDGDLESSSDVNVVMDVQDSQPTITTTGTLTTFTTCAGSASSSQTFTVSGVNLSNNITITAPTGYELSTTSGGTFNSSVSLTQSGGTVNTSTIYVRLTSNALNAASGTISVTSTGVTTQTIATGAATVNVLPASPTITSSQFNATVCEGAPVILTAIAVPAATNYLWNDPATSNTAAITVSPIANTTYTVTATNANGCASTASITVRIANPAGNFGNALNFDGINDAVLVGANSPAFQNTITIETWVKALNNTNDKNILSWGYALDGIFNWNDNVQLRLSGHKLEWGMHSYSNNVGWQSLISNKNIDDGVWHHIAIVKDGNTSRMYIDGDLEATRILTHTMTVNRFVIGAAFGGISNSQFFNGSLDELRIWNAALTIAEIRSRMNRELIGNETNLTALYNFNEGVAGANNTSITTINNATTNAHNGTITNIDMNGTGSNFVLGTNIVLPEITGNSTISSGGGTTQLSNTIYGGIWSITTNTFATINSTGLLTSTNIGQGTATVTYTLNSSLSCSSLQKSILVTVDPAAIITGPSGNAGDAATTKSINENTKPVFTFTANEPVSWSLNGGLDVAKFALNSSTGALSFITEPDYEIPTDANTNNTYIVNIKAVDAAGNISAQTITVTVLDVYDNVPPPPTLIGGVYLYGSVIPSLPAFIQSLPPNTIPVWCNTTTNICSDTHPATPIEVGRYIYQVRSYDTLSKNYSIGFANDTIIVKPLVPQVRNATYIIGLLNNPTNIAIQVTGVQGSTISYFLNATKLSSTPTLGNTVSVKRYTVSQTVNAIESDTVGFNVTMLNQNDIIHLQKIAETPVLQSNSTFNITYKFIVNNITAQDLTNVIVVDNLQNTIPITSEYSILNTRATGGLVANASFNGSSDIHMSTSTSKVAAYAKDTLVFTLNIKPKGFSGVMNNTAIIVATTPYGAIAMVSSALTKDAETTKSPTPITLPDVIIDIPEVFTPNRDGVNDKFVILKPFGTTLNLEIFNRWGNIVYSNANYNSEWDGRGTNNFIGQDLLDGGYYYNLKATNSNGETKIFKGFVIIQR
jgi:gliding motility-associated-like protein